MVHFSTYSLANGCCDIRPGRWTQLRGYRLVGAKSSGRKDGFSIVEDPRFQEQLTQPVKVKYKRRLNDTNISVNQLPHASSLSASHLGEWELKSPATITGSRKPLILCSSLSGKSSKVGGGRLGYQ